MYYRSVLEEQAIEAGIEYLEKKYYDKKFLPIAAYLESSYIDVRVYPEGGNPEKDMITLYVKLKNDEIVIEDNYFFEYIREEYDVYIKNMLAPYFKNLKVFYRKSCSGYPKDLKIGDTWEYIRTNNIRFPIGIFIFTDDDISEDILEDIFRELRRKMFYDNVEGILTIYHIHKGYIDSINEDNHFEFLKATGDEYHKRFISQRQKALISPELWKDK